jgi:lipoic acid synthetase
LPIGDKKPPWLKVRIPPADVFNVMHERLGGLKTVCQSAKCPNIGECFRRGTATFLIMGDTCTRNCGFCGVMHGTASPLDPDEPIRVAEAVHKLGLGYAVVTSVTRDDLPDGGASHYSATIEAIRALNPGCRIEVLIPDFRGDVDALRVVVESKPDVLNHNIETVPRLYPKVRPQADYRRSLELLENAAKMSPGLLTKSGLMVGVGETMEEVEGTFHDLLDAGCVLLTIGQYLRPSRENIPVERYVHPDEFEELRKLAIQMGFRNAASGPFVRSSYFADEQAKEEWYGR